MWLADVVEQVLEDLQGASPIGELIPVATLVDGANGVCLGVIEPGQVAGPLPPAPEAEALQPDAARADGPGGGNFVSRNASGPSLIAWVAEILQEDLAETKAAWGQSRPPCPYHPHPARPVVHDNEAWWVCERTNEPLYRIGHDDVPKATGARPSWSPQTRRSRKRKHSI